MSTEVEITTSKSVALDAYRHLTEVYYKEYAAYAKIVGILPLGYPGERYFHNIKDVLDAIYERKGQILAVRKAIEEECGKGTEVDKVNNIIDSVYKDLGIERTL